jgi:hypothetical protein
LLFLTQTALADWHTGKVLGIHVGYDGSMTQFSLSGWTRTNCTCYSTWPNYVCLNRTRASFKEEVSILMLARALDEEVTVYIDETSCSVQALSGGAW